MLLHRNHVANQHQPQHQHLAASRHSRQLLAVANERIGSHFVTDNEKSERHMSIETCVFLCALPNVLMGTQSFGED